MSLGALLRRVSLLVALLAFAVPAVAEANFVYWTNQNESTIGRAKLNGANVNNSFVTGLNDPHGIALDSKYIYWSQGDATTGSIGRARLDGSGANPNFIPHGAGVDAPFGIAVTPAAVFWANGSNTIGRANLDGTGPVSNFITSAGTLCGLAADQTYLYWLRPGAGQIGRATLSNSSSDSGFITGISGNCGVAVGSGFIYWGSSVNSIGRATLAGGSPTDSFIPSATAGGDPCGVAVNPQFIFWGNPTAQAIGRANINGTARFPIRANGATQPCLLAAAPTNKIAFTGTARNKRKGTARVAGNVKSPGQVQLSATAAGASAASKVKPVGLTLTARGPFSLPIKVKGKTAKKLRRKGRARVRYFVTFTPSGVAGVPNTIKRTVTLIKKRKK